QVAWCDHPLHARVDVNVFKRAHHRTPVFAVGGQPHRVALRATARGDSPPADDCKTAGQQAYLRLVLLQSGYRGRPDRGASARFGAGAKDQEQDCAQAHQARVAVTRSGARLAEGVRTDTLRLQQLYEISTLLTRFDEDVLSRVAALLADSLRLRSVIMVLEDRSG